jgi:hypothetical protein
MMSIALLFTYNSIKLIQDDSIWMPLAVYQDVQWSSVTCIIRMNGSCATNIMSALYDLVKQYDDEHTSHVMERWKLHGNISRNGYGNAMIGRYGGCFEEDIRRLMCDRAYHITGFGCTSEDCTNSWGEKGHCTVPKRLANGRKVGVRIIHGLTLVIKNSHTYCKSLLALKAKYYSHAPREEVGRS